MSTFFRRQCPQCGSVSVSMVDVRIYACDRCGHRAKTFPRTTDIIGEMYGDRRERVNGRVMPAEGAE
ncbi:hypothetical protein V5F77_04315 [Xanthobacter sp. DSM 24535]|uniref:hypothetical protein n=1 Tax=Roseixanthobacter psychrophilus TaxID=3119917 RepID=UPI00372BD7B5